MSDDVIDVEQFVSNIVESGLLLEDEVRSVQGKLPNNDQADTRKLAGILVKHRMGR